MMENLLSYIQITSICMYVPIEKRNNNLMQCHGIYIKVNVFNYLLENDICRNPPQKKGVLMCDFRGFRSPI